MVRDRLWNREVVLEILHIQIFSGFRDSGAKGKDVSVSVKKVPALLSYLARPPGREHSRKTSPPCFGATVWTSRLAKACAPRNK